MSTRTLLTRPKRYFLVRHYLAELALKLRSGTDTSLRKSHLATSRQHHARFLRLLDSYNALSKPDAALLESLNDSPDTFSAAGPSAAGDPSRRRDAKIARFRQEKELKQRIEALRRDAASAERADDATVRELHLAVVAQAVHTAFQSLEGVAQELQILKLAPPPAQQQQQGAASGVDARERDRNGGVGGAGYSERVDPPLAQLLAGGRAGPLLSKDGKPLRPFTLLDSRQRLQQGVFRPDHNLPTMTIDEYLEEEKRRGGIIEGGGEQSGVKKELDEDDEKAVDAETLRQRQWDEFVEENPKGSGNTINRG